MERMCFACGDGTGCKHNCCPIWTNDRGVLFIFSSAVISPGNRESNSTNSPRHIFSLTASGRNLPNGAPSCLTDAPPPDTSGNGDGWIGAMDVIGPCPMAAERSPIAEGIQYADELGGLIRIGGEMPDGSAEPVLHVPKNIPVC